MHYSQDFFCILELFYVPLNVIGCDYNLDYPL
jgi:hypothetical protein